MFVRLGLELNFLGVVGIFVADELCLAFILVRSRSVFSLIGEIWEGLVRSHFRRWQEVFVVIILGCLLTIIKRVLAYCGFNY